MAYNHIYQSVYVSLCVYTPLCLSSSTVHEECYSAVDRHSLKPPCQIWDHVWSLRRVCQPGGDHRQFLGGETAGNSLWQIKPNRDLTLPSDELSLNLLRLAGEKNDLGPRLSTVCRRRVTHKRMSWWFINSDRPLSASRFICRSLSQHRFTFNHSVKWQLHFGAIISSYKSPVTQLCNS